jgi:hypothetical protein
VTDADIEFMYRNTKVYVDRRERYRKGLKRIG